MEKQQFLIDAQLAQAILDYLAQRPYHEVYQLIAAIQRLEPAAPEPELPTYDEMMKSAHREAVGNVDDPLPASPHTPARVKNL